MLLTIALTRPPATDLGYLLHRAPGRVPARSLSFGPALRFYPSASISHRASVGPSRSG